MASFRISDSPQLVETLAALFWLAAVNHASAAPKSLFGAWYTMMLACGASAPDCSTSRVVSPDPELALGLPGPPSTLSCLMRLALVLILIVVFQKCVASDGLKLANVMMPSVSP